MFYSEIAGQDEIKNYLINSIKNEELSHCYVFEGPKDIGKYDLSLVFAQSLLCENFDLDPCNKCNSCQKINTFNHPDIHIFKNEEKNIKREVVDGLIESIYKKPYEAKKKIYIIDNSQDMTQQAANTFLKTLEEPPGDSIIILLTTNSNFLLPTIVSRCQVIKFKNIDMNEIKRYLIEKYNIDEIESHVAAYYSKGILNKAINIVEGKDNIAEKRKEVIKIFDKIINSDSQIIFEYENYFEEQKDNIDVIIEIMMIWIRDIAFCKNNIGQLIVNKDFSELVRKHADMMVFNNSDKLIEYLQVASDNIKYNVNYKLISDKILLRLQEEFKNDKSSWCKI